MKKWRKATPSSRFRRDLLLRHVVFFQGESSGGRVKVKVSEHVSDVRGFADTVLAGRRPVYIAHR